MSELIEVKAWEDEDTNDGEWPYPDRWVKSEVLGELADRVRAKLDAEPSESVFITEHVVSGGYSEYTQEDYNDFTIECAGWSAYFEGTGWKTSLDELLDWLDGAK